jgi:peptidyl-prolyl cis-trans isomerase A (cyclophilin A)
MRSSLLLLVLLAGCKKPAEKVVVPEVFHAQFETSKGNFTVEARREWAPRGVDRFHELLRMHYFDQGRFFRVVPGFIVQFGVHNKFQVHDIWRKMFIPDDPPMQLNLRGTLAYAKSDAGTRSTEIFINLADNKDLDDQRFVPFAKITEGMDVVDRFYSGYGELRPKGKNLDAGRIEEEANEYLIPRFPNLDYVKTTKILP